jgi:hypothetical protein
LKQIFWQSWEVVKQHLGLSAGLTLVLFLITGTAKFIPLLGNFLLVPFYFGYMRCLWKLKNNEAFDYSDFFWGWMDLNRLGHLILSQFLVSIFFTFGLLLLILPGIWIAVATALTSPCLLFLNGTDSIGAIKESMALVKNHWWQVFGFLCVCLLILAMGALVLGVGLLVAFPLMTLMLLFLTEKLQREKPTQAEAAFAPIP